MRSSASESRSLRSKAQPSFPRSWMANVPRNLKEGKEHGSQTVCGGCWKIVGNLNRMPDQVSILYSDACKTMANPRFDHDGDGRVRSCTRLSFLPQERPMDPEVRQNPVHWVRLFGRVRRVFDGASTTQEITRPTPVVPPLCVFNPYSNSFFPRLEDLGFTPKSDCADQIGVKHLAFVGYAVILSTGRLMHFRRRSAHATSNVRTR